MKIDVHNHFFPLAYVKELGKRNRSPTVEQDNLGRTLIKYAGDFNIVEEAHTHPEVRLREMDRCGIDMQVLSLTTPGLENIESTSDRVALARIVNDAFSTIGEKYPDRFTAFAALPLRDVNSAVSELERAVTTLGLKGGTLFSNVAGKSLDAQEFRPLFEKASQLDVPLFIHPTTPATPDIFLDFRLVPLLGFPFDTTVAITRLVFSGVFEQYPKLKLILAHAGGTMPYLAERIDNGYRAYSECQKHIKKLPSEYLKLAYLDTVLFHPPALICACAFMGPEKLVLGSDYPHQIGNLKQSVSSIEDLDYAPKEKILEENAARLLKIS
ncbi:MAG: amidohydrolase family protein [Candidatus Heimdallarchaeota archaeon]